MKSTYFYLHGFASSPQSNKARQLGDRFAERHLTLHVPDLNFGNFTHLTFTRQLERVSRLFPPPPSPVTLIGSSFGGLTALWLAQQSTQVDRLVILAPALHFLYFWLPTLDPTALHDWEARGYLDVYHYGEGRDVPLHYNFVKDLQQYRDERLGRSRPTLILHGQQDEVIPIQASRAFVRDRPWANLVELDSDHSLANVLPEIWHEIRNFCQI
ncbi:MAG: alpha/beta fold hydrolase [Cyanobacteria bacterium J007]|nr:MAG: alpha/beta fold hydrolase [Cyanobacteria bacterium J007]